MLEVIELRKHYADLAQGQIIALDGISFSARPGEIFGLLGPNGAGKTTALRILSTMLKPTSGHVRVCGYDAVEQPELVRANIGFVSANTNTYERMTAWELVWFFGKLHGLESAELDARMQKLFEQLQLQEIKHLLAARMSTGMKQKVSIARALVHDPPVIIFDEATSGLDVLVARSLLKTVRELAEQGKCVIFSTHIMREAERLCQRFALMHRGKLLTEGTLAEVKDRHQIHDLEDLFFSLLGESGAKQTSVTVTPAASAVTL